MNVMLFAKNEKRREQESETVKKRKRFEKVIEVRRK